MNYVAIVDNVATEVVQSDPMIIFPWRAHEFTPYEGPVNVGDILVDGVFVAPPPPPLIRLNFEVAFGQRLQQEVMNWKNSKFEEALALSPNYPALPESIEAFEADMDTMDWTWVQAMLEQRA